MAMSDSSNDRHVQLGAELQQLQMEGQLLTRDLTRLEYDYRIVGLDFYSIDPEVVALAANSIPHTDCLDQLAPQRDGRDPELMRNIEHLRTLKQQILTALRAATNTNLAAPGGEDRMQGFLKTAKDLLDVTEEVSIDAAEAVWGLGQKVLAIGNPSSDIPQSSPDVQRFLLALPESKQMRSLGES